MSARPPAGMGAARLLDGRGDDVRVAQQLRQARRLVRREHDPQPSRRQRATVAARSPMAAGGSSGSCQPNGLPPGGAPSASLSQVSSSVRAASSRAFQSRGVGVGRRPALGQLAGALQLARAARPPATTGSRPRPSTSAGSSMNQMPSPRWSSAGAGREVAAPELGGVAQLALLEVREVRRPGARAAGRRRCPAESRSAAPASRRQQELARGQQASPPRPRPRPAGRPGRRRAATRSRRRTTRCAPAAAARPGRRRRCRRGARTRPGRRPRATPRSPARPARGGRAPASGAGPARSVERRLRACRPARACAGRAPGRWPRGRAPGRPARRHAASAATRAALLVAHQLRALVGERGPRLQGHDGAGSPSHAVSSSATRSAISASRAIQTRRSPLARARAAARKDLAPCGIGGVGDVAQRGADATRACAPPSRATSARSRPTRRAAPRAPTGPGCGGADPRRAPRDGLRRDGRRAAGPWPACDPRPGRSGRRRRSPRRRPAPRRRTARGRRCTTSSTDVGDASVAARRPRSGVRSSLTDRAPRGPRRAAACASRSSCAPCRSRRAAGPLVPGRPAGATPLPSAAGAPPIGQRGAGGRFGDGNVHAFHLLAARAGAVARPVLDRVRGRVQHPLERPLLVRLEARQHVVDHVLPGLADAHAQPRELLGAQLRDDRLAARCGRPRCPPRAAAACPAAGRSRPPRPAGPSRGTRSRASTLRTATPDRFMYVVGLTSTRSRSAAAAAHGDRGVARLPRPVQPARSAMRSSTIQPTLWRVPSYCLPGLPNPTTIFTVAPCAPPRPLAGHGDGPRPGIPERGLPRRW